MRLLPVAFIASLFASAASAQAPAPPTAAVAAEVAKQLANPIGQVWCGAMMLEFLGHKDAHDAVLSAIEKVLDPKSGAPRTRDIGGDASTEDVGRAIAAAL